MVEFKQYKERIDNKKANFCECGHLAFDHKGYEFNKSKRECTRCMCPQYLFKIALTVKEEFELIEKGELHNDWESHNLESGSGKQ